MNAVTQDLSNLALLAGSPEPLGATWTGEGVNFAVYSSGATNVELCLFDERGERELTRVALPQRTANVWHGFLPAPAGAPGLVYGLRVHGPYDPTHGLRYNPNKLLIDPYARSLAGAFQWSDALLDERGDAPAGPDPADSAPYNYKARVIDGAFDWGEDQLPATPWRDTVIYEAHVKGLTKLHPAVPERERGTYLGLANPDVIAHMKSLGVTAVELLPVQAFVSERFLIERGLTNYWGYNPIAWFAPAPQYAVEDPVREFKTMVKALHAAGLEVILDVVFNHTCEGNERGPTVSLRGLDNIAYYRLEPGAMRHYADRSGCGNTIDIAHPAMLRMVIDCLRYWVEEMHVDGFRFDLAAVLGRDNGLFRTDASFFKAVAAEPALRYVKLIAEPWDIGPDGYHLGRFPAPWAEWNDLYRDTMRGFWRGNPGILGAFAERFAGSSDLFRERGRRPTSSINYVACHDGFTLRDATTYEHKHNEANGENNLDGRNYSLSWNCGVEGPTDDPQIRELRERQMRNMLATLLLSQGVPMLLAGDELGRTQRGNNNAYCQDNELSWLSWEESQCDCDLTSFVRQLLTLRKQSPGLRRDTFLKGARWIDRDHKDVSWLHPLGRELDIGDWRDPNARALGVLIGHAFSDPSGTPNGHLLFLCNAGSEALEFRLPEARTDAAWRVVFDTAHWRASGPTGGMAADAVYQVAAHSCVLLADGDAPASVRSGFSRGDS
ncbi:MAG TPA: glycogen debranching protein GlgX [Steroidobacter sp.]|jgi:glycogen operon protein|nr:glycogen debranching protein GlgX [Steroidobacteraceae bacterium]HLS81798.1 glycogen debranching protein GlgX [Steroidobacter sp.]